MGIFGNIKSAWTDVLLVRDTVAVLSKLGGAFVGATGMMATVVFWFQSIDPFIKVLLVVIFMALMYIVILFIDEWWKRRKLKKDISDSEIPAHSSSYKMFDINESEIGTIIDPRMIVADPNSRGNCDRTAIRTFLDMNFPDICKAIDSGKRRLLVRIQEKDIGYIRGTIEGFYDPKKKYVKSVMVPNDSQLEEARREYGEATARYSVMQDDDFYLLIIIDGLLAEVI